MKTTTLALFLRNFSLSTIVLFFIIGNVNCQNFFVTPNFNCANDQLTNNTVPGNSNLLNPCVQYNYELPLDLIFEDNFDGSQLNTQNWLSDIATHSGMFNNPNEPVNAQRPSVVDYAWSYSEDLNNI